MVGTRQTWCLEVADIRGASPVVATILVVTHSAQFFVDYDCTEVLRFSIQCQVVQKQVWWGLGITGIFPVGLNPAVMRSSAQKGCGRRHGTTYLRSTDTPPANAQLSGKI